MSGDDILYSSGTSKLEDNTSDTLKGFGGFDAYIVGDKDTIDDSDGLGEVVFDNITLKGGIYDKDKNMALFNLSSYKGAVSYDENDEKQIYNPFPNFRKEI